MFAHLWPGKDSMDETVGTFYALLDLAPKLLAAIRGKGTGEDALEAMAERAGRERDIDARLSDDEE